MARLSAQTNQLLYVLSAMTAVLLPMSIVSDCSWHECRRDTAGRKPGGLPATAVALGVAALVLYFVQRLDQSPASGSGARPQIAHDRLLRIWPHGRAPARFRRARPHTIRASAAGPAARTDIPRPPPRR